MSRQVVNTIGVLINVIYFSFLFVMLVNMDRFFGVKTAGKNCSHTEAVVLTIISLCIFQILLLYKYHCDKAAIPASKASL